MHPDSVQTSLKSAIPLGEYIQTVSLDISVYFSKTNTFDKNTIEFRCDPKGSNYELTILRAVFEDWSKVIEIRDFLSYCFSDTVVENQTKTVQVANAFYNLCPANSEGHQIEDLNEFTITVSNNRVEFGGMGSMVPHFHTYEKVNDREPADANNVGKILDFFDEIISLHPSYHDGKQENSGADSIFNEHQVEDRLSLISRSNSSLFEDYQKAIREFKDNEFEDSVRDIGRAAETLIELLCENIYDENNIPNRTGGRLSKLDSTEDGVPTLIGKSISPLWWLRNRVNHPSEYEVTRDDAQYALLCFQTAMEKYVQNILNSEE